MRGGWRREVAPSACGSPGDRQARGFGDRDDPRDGCVPIEHLDRRAGFHRSEMLGKVGLQFRHANRAHAHLVTSSSHFQAARQAGSGLSRSGQDVRTPS